MLGLKASAALAALFALGNVHAQEQVFAETTVVVIDKVPAVAVRTVYATSHITVFGCPPWETNCPVHAGQTQAVVTATIGATTTVCPLTLSQARLSRGRGSAINTGGPLQTSTTTWPTIYSLPSTWPSMTWESSIWASIFPTGAPAFSDGGETGTFADGEYTGPPYPLPTLDPAQALILGFSGSGASSNFSGSANSSGVAGAAGGGFTSTEISVTTGSFAAILSSNMTAFVTTLNAFTGNYTGGAGVAGPTGGVAGAGASGFGSNGTYAGGSTLTTLSNGSVVTTGTPAIPLQTVNVGPAVPVSLFSLLVAVSALAFAL